VADDVGQSALTSSAPAAIATSEGNDAGRGTERVESPSKQEGPVPLTVSKPGGPDRKVLVFAGAAVVAVALVIGAIVLNGRSPADETTSPSTSNTLGETQTTQTTASEPAVSLSPSTAAARPTTSPPQSTPELPIDGEAAEIETPGRFDEWVTGAAADPLRSRNWASAGPTSTPTVVWRIDDPVGGAPVVSDGILYASFQDATLRAIDFATGSEIWLRETSFGNRTPTVTENAVFFVDGLDVVAVDRATGTDELLRIVPPAGLDVPASPDAPTVVGGVAYVVYQRLDSGVWASELLAIDLESGLVKWRWNTQAGRGMLPVMVTDDAVVVVSEFVLSAFELETGAERWTVTLDGAISPNNALIADGALIVRGDRLRALELSDGSQRWSLSASSLQYASAGGSVFTQSLDVRAVDTTTGAVTWSTAWTEGRLLSDAISVGDGVVYVQGSFNGAIGAYDTVTGAELWAIDHEGGLQSSFPLVVHGGVLVAVEADRQLVAFG